MKSISAKELRAMKKKVKEFEQETVPEINDSNWFNWSFRKQAIDKMKEEIKNA